MTGRRRVNTRTVSCAALLLAGVAGRADCAATRADEFLLIDRNLHVREIRLAQIDERVVTHVDDDDDVVTTAMGRCIALVRPAAEDARDAFVGKERGRLLLANGQRLPGSLAASAPPGADHLAWLHPWLGRIDVPLDHVAGVSLRPAVRVAAAGRADTILLRNGDRVEGFVTEIGDPIVIEVEGEGVTRSVQIALDLADAVALISPKRAPSGRRVWFRDGTVLDVESLRVGDDGYVRLGETTGIETTQPVQIRLSDLVAVRFDAGSMVPLGSLAPPAVNGTSPRFVVPGPTSLDPDAPLGLGGIEYRGPVLARYTLPSGCRRFAALAIVPETARAWGDVELILRDDDEEIFRVRLNGAAPTAPIAVPLDGAELTIELGVGAHGPIQDRVVLTRPMLLVD